MKVSQLITTIMKKGGVKNLNTVVAMVMQIGFQQSMNVGPNVQL